jgi:hypothetical protein
MASEESNKIERKELLKKAITKAEKLRETAVITKSTISDSQKKELKEANDRIDAKRNRDWSILGHQVMGAERF